MNELTNISPIDGRYSSQTSELSEYFSEMTLMKYRLMIEVEYLIALSKETGVKEIKLISPANQKKLRGFYENFSLADAKVIKKIESITKHDVKAIEYFFQKKIEKTPLKNYVPFIHFALTSEDVNNLSFSLMWKDGLHKVYLKSLTEVYKNLRSMAKKYKDTTMLALTHGQTATPTTVGKEIAVVVARIGRQIKQLKNHNLQGKFGGATGTWGAHTVAYPNVNWLNFSSKFIKSLGLEPNLLTIQIEPHDSLAESFQNLIRINTILTDFCRDTWMYISRGIFAQKNKAGEIGSSTMPHKINPIYFENAEGNLGIANAYLSHLSQKLPISRMQRDLTDSTVLRNQGVALSHSLLAVQNILNGLSRLTVNKYQLKKELDENPEVLAEAIQTILRKLGHTNAYEQLKSLTRGQEMTLETIYEFVKNLNIPKIEKDKLLKLTPENYTGLASKLIARL
ncbi:adenylosuccinate lyase [Candidatus Falkowbacteria bacterium]|jgi:adenylosuccinate lyase|nr:adenylosuccinate lyase [Candidatus Falkowbacteria bacterium]